MSPTNLAIGIAAVIVVAALGLRLWRVSDARHDRAVWADLARTAAGPARVFDPTLTDSLPEPARRYFRYTIPPGEPIRTVVEIEMNGELGLGTQENPKYSPMRARQILASPVGLVWRLSSGAISGSDGVTPETSWTRFWLFGLIPIVRAGDDLDHQRSAFGRVVAEGAFWTPATLLPGPHVRWEAVDSDTARAVVRRGELEQTVEITVEASGRPSKVVIWRWSNANAEQTYRVQSFGGYLGEFKSFIGYRLPTRVEGGNLIDTDEYFPFFKAEVTSIHFIG